MTDQRDTIARVVEELTKTGVPEADARYLAQIACDAGNLMRLEREKAAVVAERDALRDAIRHAPHTHACPQSVHSECCPEKDCTCWKAAALAGTQKRE